MRRPTRGAFTLIELLVALAIVAIMSAGVAIPLFLSNSDDHKLRDAARHLTDMMQLCNSMAVFESAAYRLYFDPTAGQCAIAFERFPREEPGVYTLYEASGFSFYTLPDGVTFADLVIESDGTNETEPEEETASETSETNEEDPYIEFRRDGTADTSRFVLTCAGRTLGVTISGLTSAVRLVENPVIETDQDQAEETEGSAVLAPEGLDTSSSPALQENSQIPGLGAAETKASTLRDRLTRSSGNNAGGGSNNSPGSRSPNGAAPSGGPRR
ncbi:MAG TPA: prepilin-type N-terminal cleavage/methylation domain-containing protein [Candidatus Sumerlaeota bacterium]|nr:prepilin-type N-terminal cleavage/methylation domain-containing protein [Candidatus Sumerlaeota bacterium]HPS02478.1 prepilin-type N-terminal cleavage/methylation domain-containing protein [Candidatus Sumerlaeota bacterium]